MGTMAHHLLVVTADGYVLDYPFMPDIEEFRASLPQEWAALVVGPFTGMVNHTLTWMFLPDGSKEGWPESDAGDIYRQRFADLFAIQYEEDGSTPFDVALVQYGGTYPERAELSDPRRDWRTICHEGGATILRRIINGAVVADREIT